MSNSANRPDDQMPVDWYGDLRKEKQKKRHCDAGATAARLADARPRGRRDRRADDPVSTALGGRAQREPNRYWYLRAECGTHPVRASQALTSPTVSDPCAPPYGRCLDLVAQRDDHAPDLQSGLLSQRVAGHH